MPRHTIGVVKEKRTGERRALLLPLQVKTLIGRGYEVLVEHDLGAGIGIADEAYCNVGGTIVDTERVWSAQLVLKYKAPIREEFSLLRPGMNLAAFLHAEGDPELIEALCKHHVTSFAFEFLRSENGALIARSDAEISGKLAVIYAAYHLQAHVGGRGVLLADLSNVVPPKAVIIGHGNAGGAAARMACALGAEVTVFGADRKSIREFEAAMKGQVRCLINTPETLIREVRLADVVIGAISHFQLRHPGDD